MQRQAFSLVELIVAIGILILMLSLAGQVFNTTIQSTGQATALTETHQLLRALERTIRDDLREVQPGQSLILIQSNPVNAYWTAEGRAADTDGDPSTGYAHVADPTREDANGNVMMPRADILMFFTTRDGVSYAFTNPPVTASLQQVVYGHAELGEYVPGTGATGDLYDFKPNQLRPMFPVPGTPPYPSITQVAPVPASQWHLARRGVLLVQTPPPPSPPPPTPAWVDALWANNIPKPDKGLADLTILQGAADVIGNFNSKWVEEPGVTGPWFAPAIFDGGVVGEQCPYLRSQLDPTPPAAYGDRLGHYLLPNCASFKVEWALDPHSDFVGGRLAGEKEIFWFDPGYLDPEGVRTNDDPLWTLQAAIDRDPVNLPVNLASLLSNRVDHRDGLGVYSLADRFRDPELQRVRGDDPNVEWEVLGAGQRPQDLRPNLVLFGANRRDIKNTPGIVEDDEIVAEDIFPVALRITIDVFDKEGRLERPIRHVMVIPVGG